MRKRRTSAPQLPRQTQPSSLPCRIVKMRILSYIKINTNGDKHADKNHTIEVVSATPAALETRGQIGNTIVISENDRRTLMCGLLLF
jgi:hypothetical protein